MSFKKVLFMFSFLIYGLLVHAQPQDLDPLDPGGPQSGGVPVDGGLVFLLAAGAGYGAKKAYDFRKKNKKEKDRKSESSKD
jgi:hypothetical protein